MATLMSAALALLGEDIDDGFRSTTTAAGDTGKSYLTDDDFYEKVADWVSDGMIVYLPLGPDGASAAETRVVDRIENNKLYPKTAFSAQVDTGVSFEVHRLFTRKQKLIALRYAATLICPGIHTVVRDMETIEIVANQYEYVISSLSIYQNRPHQVLLAQQTIRDIWVASATYAVGDYVRPTTLAKFTGLVYKCTAITTGTAGSSEPTWPTTVDGTVVDSGVTWTCQEELDYSSYPMLPLHDWDITPDGKLFLNASYTAGRKLMIVGIKPLAFTSSGANETIALDSPFTLVLSAEAALYLHKQRVNSVVGQDQESAHLKVQNWTRELAERKAKYPMKPPDGTLITGPGLTV